MKTERYAIFGAGVSGRAARDLAVAFGFEAVLFDEAGAGDAASFGTDDAGRFDGFVFSPGFSVEHPWRVIAVASGRPCLSELAFAARYWKGRIIGVTGTNGKTTLTQLIHEAFQRSGYHSIAAGNIGLPFAQAVLEPVNHDAAYAVLEISSFQAELADGLELDAVLWTNFAEDHLDRYASMADYFAAKASLLDRVRASGARIVGPDVADQMPIFGRSTDGCLIAAERDALGEQLTAASVFRLDPYSANFALAAELWRHLGESEAALLEAADEFELAPHRLSCVAEVNGVHFWNDSKATNFHAALAAIESMDRPIVWIGGGRMKGGDVEAFARAVAAQVDAICLYGEVAVSLAGTLEGAIDRIEVRAEFTDAVLAAARLGSTYAESCVLLSPGFASFDQFDSYAARGKSFVETVLSLKSTSGPS